jgi:hypothetical protein
MGSLRRRLASARWYEWVSIAFCLYLVVYSVAALAGSSLGLAGTLAGLAIALAALVAFMFQGADRGRSPD